MSIKFFQAIKQGFWIVVKNPITLILMSLFLGILILLEKVIFPILHPILQPLPEIAEVILKIFAGSLFFALYLGVIIRSVYNLTQGLKGVTAFFEGIKIVVRKIITLTIASFFYFLIIFGVGAINYKIFYFLNEIGISIISIIALIGLIAGTFIIPLFLATRFYYYSYAILIDNKKAVDSLKTSWQLVKKDLNGIKTFGIAFCFAVVAIIFQFIFRFLPESIILNIILFLILSVIAIILLATLVIAYLQMSRGDNKEKEVGLLNESV